MLPHIPPNILNCTGQFSTSHEIILRAICKIEFNVDTCLIKNYIPWCYFGSFGLLKVHYNFVMSTCVPVSISMFYLMALSITGIFYQLSTCSSNKHPVVILMTPCSQMISHFLAYYSSYFFSSR